MRISDWSSDVCSSDLQRRRGVETRLVAVRLRPVVGHGHCSIGEGKRMIPRSATEIAISCVSHLAEHGLIKPGHQQAARAAVAVAIVDLDDNEAVVKAAMDALWEHTIPIGRAACRERVWYNV